MRLRGARTAASAASVCATERPAGDPTYCLAPWRRRGRRCRRRERARRGGGRWGRVGIGADRSRRAEFYNPQRPRRRAATYRSRLAFARHVLLPPFMHLPDTRPRQALHAAPPARLGRCPAAGPLRRARSARAARLTAIVTAEPADAQRLDDEIAFFAPDLRIAVFPDWETLPYDTFSPHQDLISERLATLWRIRAGRRRRRADAGHDRAVRLAPPSFLAGYTFHFKHKQKPRRGRAQGAAHARRLHPREPGRRRPANTRCAAG